MRPYNSRSDIPAHGGRRRADGSPGVPERNGDLDGMVPGLSKLFGPLYADQVGRIQNELQQYETLSSVQPTGATPVSTTEPDSPDETDEVRILHVDDEPDITELSAAYLKRLDDRLEVVSESRAENALERFQSEDSSIDCIVSDYRMPGMDGASFLEEVREEDEHIPFIMFTGSRYEDLDHDLAKEDITDYIEKNGRNQFEVLAERVVSAVDGEVAS